MAEGREFGVIVDELSQAVAELHRGHNEGIQTLHGWIDAYRVGDQWLPVCACGIHGPFVLTRDAMYELVCERLELERASAARQALVNHA